MDNDIITRLDAIDVRLETIEKLLTGSNNMNQPSAIPQAPPRSLSITEYVLEKKPSDDNQRTLVLANYLEVYRSQADFTSDELRQVFIDSRLKVPSNISDKIGKCVQKGQIMPVGERDGKKTWCLTMTGQAVVKEGFGK